MNTKKKISLPEKIELLKKLKQEVQDMQKKVEELQQQIRDELEELDMGYIMYVAEVDIDMNNVDEEKLKQMLNIGLAYALRNY